MAEPGREELKEALEQVGREHGHTLGPWLELPHAAQIGCLACDMYAFVEFAPRPKLHPQAFERDCPAAEGRLIETGE